MTLTPDTLWRVGEVSQRSGVSTHLLRVWEQRYGLLTPVRSTGGYRLYSDADLARVTQMKHLRENGVSAAAAAKLVLSSTRVVALSPTAQTDTDDSVEVVAQLRGAIEAFDEAAVQTILDTALQRHSLEGVLSQVVIPLLRALGTGWESGEMTVAHEHFATALIRRRLTPYAASWAANHTPRAVLACPSGEHHDLMLFAFGVVLGRRGWHITYLGPDTPAEAVAEVAQPGDVVVMAVARTDTLRDNLAALSELGRAHQVWVAGAGAAPDLLASSGLPALPRDLLDAADELTARSR